MTLPGDWGNLILADRTQKLIYVVSDSVIACRKLSTSEIDVRRLVVPEDYQDLEKLRHGWAHRRNYLLDHPEAATIGGETYLFIRAAEGALY